MFDAGQLVNNQSSITNQPPELWQEINQAWFSQQACRSISAADGSALTSSTNQAADAILAIRDWLLPEENEPPVGEGEPWPMAYQQMSDAKWEQRQALREVLTAEAEKAARGRVGDQCDHQPSTEAILALAAIIRKVDGSHSKGAAYLAGAILADPDAAKIFGGGNNG